MKRILTLVLAIMLVMGTVVGCSSTKKEEAASSSDYAVYTDNFGFTQGEFSYLFNYVVSQQSSYLAQMGLDMEKSLKEQQYTETETFFDFFKDQALGYAESFLVFCEEAKARGIELTEEDQQKITEDMEALKTAAKENSFDTVDKYLQSMYGEKVTEKDYRLFTEKAALANKMYYELINSYEYTDEEIQAYFDGKADAFTNVEYMSFDFSANEERKITAEMVKTAASELAAVTSQTAFEDYIVNYIKAHSTEEELGTFDEASFRSQLVTKGTVDQADEAVKTLIAGAENTTFVSEDAESGTSTVYFLVKKPYVDTTASVDVRHILLTTDTYETEEKALAKAEEVLKTWEDGDATAETFGQLATDFSEDPGSAQNGGLYEAVTSGMMVPEFDAWIFDASRQVGDTGIVKTSYGYHIMFFDGKGLEAWQNAVVNTMKSESYQTDYDALVAKYPNKTNDKVIDGIEK